MQIARDTVDTALPMTTSRTGVVGIDHKKCMKDFYPGLVVLRQISINHVLSLSINVMSYTIRGESLVRNRQTQFESIQLVSNMAKVPGQRRFISRS